MHYRQATSSRSLALSQRAAVTDHQGTAIQPVALATPSTLCYSKYAPIVVSCCRQAHHTPCTASGPSTSIHCQNLWFPYLVCCCVSSLPVLLFTCLLDLTTPDFHLAITLATTAHSFHIWEQLMLIHTTTDRRSLNFCRHS